MEFLNPWAFLALLLIFPLIFIKNKKLPFSKETINKITYFYPFNKKKRLFIFIAAYVFLVIALARPVINNSTQKIKISNLNIGIILSAGITMKCNDVYPDRFAAAITKLKKLFSTLDYQNVALIIASKRPYLLSPLTTDYDSIIYLLKHIDKKELFKSYANIKSALDDAKNLIPKPRIFIVISDRYVPGKNIISYIIATKKCPYEPINPLNQKGIKFTYDNSDIKKIDSFIKKYSKTKEITIHNRKELFYYPLIIAIILIFIGSFSIRRKI